jgi:hypothetical protein
MKEKTLDVINVEDNKNKVSDVKIVEYPDLFQLIRNASSESQGCMKITKAMEISGFGCLVQVSTQQKNPDGSYSVAESLVFVPSTSIVEDKSGNKWIVKHDSRP